MGVIDLKELFLLERWRKLHGDEPVPPRLAVWPDAKSLVVAGVVETQDGYWCRLPDPARIAQLRWRARQVEEKLLACATPLQTCKREAATNRAALEEYRVAYEAHCSNMAAMRKLMDDGGLCFPAASSSTEASNSPHARCVGKVRCFFCRERLRMEGEVVPAEVDASLADVSSCSEHPLAGADVGFRANSRERQLRKAYRQRGQQAYKRRSFEGTKSTKTADTSMVVTQPRHQETWFEKHTEDPIVGGDEGGEEDPDLTVFESAAKKFAVDWVDSLEPLAEDWMRSPVPEGTRRGESAAAVAGAANTEEASTKAPPENALSSLFARPQRVDMAERPQAFPAPSDSRRDVAEEAVVHQPAVEVPAASRRGPQALKQDTLPKDEGGSAPKQSAVGDTGAADASSKPKKGKKAEGKSKAKAKGKQKKGAAKSNTEQPTPPKVEDRAVVHKPQPIAAHTAQPDKKDAGELAPHIADAAAQPTPAIAAQPEDAVQSAVASVGEDEVAAAREDCAKLAAPSTGGSPAATAATPVEELAPEVQSAVASAGQDEATEDCAKMAAPSARGSPAATAATPVEGCSVVDMSLMTSVAAIRWRRMTSLCIAVLSAEQAGEEVLMMMHWKRWRTTLTRRKRLAAMAVCQPSPPKELAASALRRLSGAGFSASSQEQSGRPSGAVEPPQEARSSTLVMPGGEPSAAAKRLAMMQRMRQSHAAAATAAVVAAVSPTLGTVGVQPSLAEAKAPPSAAATGQPSSPPSSVAVLASISVPSTGQSSPLDVAPAAVSSAGRSSGAIEVEPIIRRESGSSLSYDPTGGAADASSKSATSPSARPITPLSVGTLSVSGTDASPVRPRVGAQRVQPAPLASPRSTSGSSSSGSSSISKSLQQGLQPAPSSASPSSIEVADSLPSHRDARGGSQPAAAHQRPGSSGSGSGTDSLEGLGGKFPR